MKYGKLVRDRIPEIIKKGGGTPVTHRAKRKEYFEKLKQKLQEEVREFLEKNSEEELADILEVVYAIADFKKLGRQKLEFLREKKAKKKGKFKNKIILEKV